MIDKILKCVAQIINNSGPMNSIYVAPTKEEPPQPSTPYLEENPK